MRIARVEITRFRGFQSFVFIPREHVVVVGEPRAGRSDLIAALRRVLEPRSVMSRPSEWDVFRPLPEPPSPDGDEDDETSTPLTSVGISLLDLSDETEQLVQDRLELLSPTTGELAHEDETDDAELGVRLRYCLQYETKNSYNTGLSTRRPALVFPARNESCFAPSSSTETSRYSCAPRESCVAWPMTRTPML